MASHLDVLLGKAFRTLRGMEYNRYLENFVDPSGQTTLFYEVPLLESKPWAYLRDEVYPAFSRFLKNKSLDPETGAGTVVVVFHGANCYLLEGKKFVQAFQEIERLGSSAFHFRVLQWLAK